MKSTLSFLAILVLTITITKTANAHCEVPCGIYADEMRFKQMLEDKETIAKAIANINELAGKHDVQSLNQLVRWVNTKEDHATKTQQVIAQYFMTQRIKPDKEGYEAKLKAAHAVMVAAMKCKQSADAATAVALEKAIMAFHKAYEGK